MAKVQDIVKKAYEEVLGRAADMPGLDYWENEVSTGKVSVSDLNKALANAAIAYNPVGQDITTDVYNTSLSNATKYLSTGTTVSDRQAAEAAKAAETDAITQALNQNASQYQDMYNNISSEFQALQQQVLEANKPKAVDVTVKGVGAVTGGGKTLAEIDLEKRRGGVSKSYLGARQMQIPLANKGATKKADTTLNTTTSTGLQI